MRELVDQAVAIVANTYRVSVEEILGPRRWEPLVQARHLAIWLAKEITGWSSPELGRYFNRDHTTILYAIDVVEGRRRINYNLRGWLDDLHRQLTLPAPTEQKPPDSTTARDDGEVVA